MKALVAAVAAGLLCAALATGAPARAETARGELIEGVDVERRGSDAMITIRFTVPIQYSTHAPEDFGKSLRIYPGLRDAANSTTRGSLRLPLWQTGWKPVPPHSCACSSGQRARISQLL